MNAGWRGSLTPDGPEFVYTNQLAKALTTPEFWLNLQQSYELQVARQARQKEIDRAVRPRTEAARTPGLRFR